MVPIEVFGIILGIAIALLFFGVLFAQPWARLFGAIFLFATGVIVLYSGGIQTSYVPTTVGDTITYTGIGVASSLPWVFALSMAFILLGCLTMVFGARFGSAEKHVDPFFS